MLYERAELLVKEGMESDFEKMMNEKGVALLASFPGVKSVKFGRGVENPDKFLLLVHWEAIEAHAAYRDSAVAAEFRKMLAPFSKGGSMEHFEMN
jgi:heme-degrading monooxygenase HmoA